MDPLFAFDIAMLIQAIGLIGVFVVVFIESGLVIGFFLPGDSLLFTAGFLASQGVFDIAALVVGSVSAAIAGYVVSYAFGKKIGPTIFNRENSFFFSVKNIERTQRFFDRYGALTIFLARFLPVVRTFAPILAGVGRMRYAAYLLYSIIGALAWAAGLPIAGYWLGSVIPDIDRYLLPIVMGIIMVSFAPTVIHIVREPEYREAFRRNIFQSAREIRLFFSGNKDDRRNHPSPPAPRRGLN